MVTKTIVTSPPDISNVRADSYDKLAGYAAFRRIQDDFAEPARPSRDDVESVAGVLRDALSSSFGQDSVEYTGSEPLSPAFDRYDKKTGSWVVDDWALRNGLDGAGQVASGTHEGRTHQLILSAGTLRLTSFDARARAATEERALQARNSASGLVYIDVPPVVGIGPVNRVLAPGQAPAAEGSGAEVKIWSSKSRTRMVETLASLDYSDWDQSQGTLAMVTLTLPAKWEILVPSGADFKRMIEKFRRRWVRAVGEKSWRLLWKLEFQGRGAPHWHALMRVPVFVKGQIFTEWLSRTWADVVGASEELDRFDKKTGEFSSEYSRHLVAGTGVDFSGKEFSDPRRISMYFLGHSAKSTDGKEYQHDVPELWQKAGKGPGRFWGYSGLEKALAVVTVSYEDLVQLKRIARKVKAARDWRVSVLREQGKAMKSGAAIPGAFAVGDSVRLSKKSPGRLGRAAQRTRNRRSFAASQLGYAFVPAAVGFGPANRVSTLVLVPPAVGIGPDNLVLPSWVPQKRAAYAPFSNGQGGFVLVNDALQLGLDIARATGPAAPPLQALYRYVAATDPAAARRLIASRLP